jgi:hypothetical protein
MKLHAVFRHSSTIADAAVIGKMLKNHQLTFLEEYVKLSLPPPQPPPIPSLLA